jgi:predicted DNA binding CopG/RHH family protein
MALRLPKRNMLLLIHIALSLKTLPTVRQKNVTTVLAKWVVVSSPSGLPIVEAPYAFSVPATGAKEDKSMNAKIKYTDEPLGELKVIPDFLPSPEELVFKDDSVKVTITLSRSSVEFFKREAKKHRTPYQKMIRRLLDAYTQKYQQPLTKV